MKIFTHTSTISNWLTRRREKDMTVGFVPTMGGLHQGHISLIEASKSDNDITVSSIFVNPSQFDDAEDLQKYPRNHDVDLDMLNEAGCDVVFLPTVMEVYPPGMDTKVDVDMNGLDSEMEGKFRPGHFDGMIEVVNRLLEIIEPDKLYMGQKDYQQKTIVQYMIDKLGLNVSLVVGPIIREEDGLAMSSRNKRLDPKERQKAATLNKTLKELAALKGEKTVNEAKQEAFEKLKSAGLKPEYVEVCDGDNLKFISSWDESQKPVALAAAWAGSIRLIDNIIL